MSRASNGRGCAASFWPPCYPRAVTRYDVFRRRIIPLAFAVIFGLLAYETCQKQERTAVTFVVEYGVFATDVRAIEAEVWMNGERVTNMRRTALEGAYIGTTRFEASLPDTSGELRIDVDLANGVRKHVVRKLHVAEGETVTFDLEPDLR
jgi:hypothetical protein